MFLQVDFGVFNTLTQYGILGLITLAFGGFLWFLLKRQISSEDMLKEKVEALQKEMNDYIRQDQQILRDTVNNNTKAMNDLKEIILSKRGEH
jgi:hypothetical protein